jgi:hypothetical protein
MAACVKLTLTSAPLDTSSRIMWYLIPQSTARIFVGFPSPKTRILLFDTSSTRFLRRVRSGLQRETPAP